MQNNLQELAKLVRYYSLVSTTEAGSGHPSSSLSAADLMTVLLFGRSQKDAENGSAERGGSAFFYVDLDNHRNPNNDRLIFSKGHASPLFYSLYAVAGKVSEKEILTLRKFGSKLEGHPTLEFTYTEVPTGSLGQGLSVGVGMALNAQLEKLSYNTFVLLGDSEMAEGSVWEAMGVAAHYKLKNLVAIVDVNRLGQRGETMLGYDTETYKKRSEAFGWKAVVVDGHDLEEIQKAYELTNTLGDKPLMIIAKTLKGKGVSFIEDKDGWHGRALKPEELKQALAEIGEIDKGLTGVIAKPKQVERVKIKNQNDNLKIKITDYDINKPVATRKAYGNALVNVLESYPNAVVLDAETSNSTYSEFVKKTHPEKFFEMFIAEQNMVGAALGFSRRGKIPFVSTFAAFFSRAFDQIRMSQYADSNIKFVGSHAGVSIGEDGASQMALEDIAMFRTVFGGVVLYPSDAVSTEKLVALAARHEGNVYIRTTRKETSVLYGIMSQESGVMSHEFRIGGSCTLKSSEKDVATVIGAGVTLHEALLAYEGLKKEGINIRVIDLYSIKPIDSENIKKAAQETKNIITVEDHFIEGGLGEAVISDIKMQNLECRIQILAVKKMPKSGKPEELLAYEGIDANAIIRAVKEVVRKKVY
ncbi:MAG: transketolase [Candidatus Doudnabacteria bacterium]|nr:transketolase [Candidatus Doudnabacteria bacterium]